MRARRAGTGAAALLTPVVRVLQSVPAPHERQNPYLSLLAESLPPTAEVRWFDWRTALTGRYDVVHAHWPEIALRGATPLRRAAKRVLFAAWLLRLAATRTPIVRTLHNVEPHEAGTAVERALLRWFDARTVSWIRLSEQTPEPSGRVATIPHGHYVEWFSRFEEPDTVRSRLLYFGLIRPYKGVPELLHAFAGVPDDTASLRIVGHVQDESLRREVERAVETDRRITAELSYVDDETLTAEIGAAQLVVLPFQRLLNSGTVLLALSLARPVLLPRGPVQEALEAEVGPEWILHFQPPLTAEQLSAALAASASRTGRPDLSRRDWPGLGAATYEEYVAAVARQRRRYSE